MLIVLFFWQWSRLTQRKRQNCHNEKPLILCHRSCTICITAPFISSFVLPCVLYYSTAANACLRGGNFFFFFCFCNCLSLRTFAIFVAPIKVNSVARKTIKYWDPPLSSPYSETLVLVLGLRVALGGIFHPIIPARLMTCYFVHPPCRDSMLVR